MNIMTWFDAIIFGIVEGITEFLPVSSTYHLILTSRILGIEQTEFIKLFEVFIQSGAISAAMLLYVKEVWKNKSLGANALLAFLPTAIIGLMLYDIVKNVFFESQIISLSIFFLFGVIFLILEYYIGKGTLKLKANTKTMTLRHALLIGLGQSIALIPGVSRAGAVIVTMMLLQYKRDEAAKFSFILSIPTIFAASVLDVIQMREVVMAEQNNVYLLAIGTVTSGIVAFIVMKWFIHFLQNNTLVLFGWYRILAVIIIVLVSTFFGM